MSQFALRNVSPHLEFKSCIRTFSTFFRDLSVSRPGSCCRRLFDTRQDVKTMFEKFRTVDQDEQYINDSLENHALLVMDAIDEAISNLDDEPDVVEMLLCNGESHRRFENFSSEAFWVCKWRSCRGCHVQEVVE